MCRWKSGEAVLHETGLKVYTLVGVDSHTEIRKRHNIPEEGERTGYLKHTPLEYLPRGNDEWELTFDDDKPDWWTDGMTADAERQLRAAVQADLEAGVIGGDICLRPGASLDLPKATKAGHIVLYDGANLTLPKVVETGDIRLYDGANLTLPKATKAGHIVLYQRASLTLPKATKAGRIVLYQRASLTLPKVVETRNIVVYPGASVEHV